MNASLARGALIAATFLSLLIAGIPASALADSSTQGFTWQPVPPSSAQSSSFGTQWPASPRYLASRWGPLPQLPPLPRRLTCTVWDRSSGARAQFTTDIPGTFSPAYGPSDGTAPCKDLYDQLKEDGRDLTASGVGAGCALFAEALPSEYRIGGAVVCAVVGVIAGDAAAHQVQLNLVVVDGGSSAPDEAAVCQAPLTPTISYKVIDPEQTGVGQMFCGDIATLYQLNLGTSSSG